MINSTILFLLILILEIEKINPDITIEYNETKILFIFSEIFSIFQYSIYKFIKKIIEKREKLDKKTSNYFIDLSPHLFNTIITHKELLEISAIYKENKSDFKNKNILYQPAPIKEIYIDKNMLGCFYSFHKHYNEEFSNEYFEDCKKFLKLIYLKKVLKFKLKPDIAFYENIKENSKSNYNIDELCYSWRIIRKIKVKNIEEISKEELYKKIDKIIKKKKEKFFLIDKNIRPLYDYWETEIIKSQKYLDITLTEENFSNYLKQLIKSQKNKEISGLTTLFILKSFTEKELNEKRKKFIKKKNKNFIKNACFDMMIISEAMFFIDVQIFTKDKALKDYCINLYKSLYEQKSFCETIKDICVKNNIKISNEIKILSEELFNKLYNK